MNFSKIRLKNERNSHVNKRLNRLTTWKFFTVLYRENIWRMFGYSFLMLLCLAPIFAVLIKGNYDKMALDFTFPALNSFGFATGVWDGMDAEYALQLGQLRLLTGLMAASASILVTLMLSGGLAVIRDAFWTGKLSAVGVFKSMGKGIKANFLYAFVSTAIIAFSIFGIYAFYLWASAVLDLWLVIVLTVLLCIVEMLLVIYLLILCSVSVTYKQTVYENLDDSWRLLWLNVVPNILHLIFALLPVALYFLFSGGMLLTIYMVLIFMFGGLYFPLVWQTHMMKTFALFHPVEVKKKKQHAHQSQNMQPVAADYGQDDGADSVNTDNNEQQSQLAEQDESATDAYSMDTDVYGNADDNK